MAYFPMFIDIEKKKCLVAGGGTVALRKVRVLLDFGAQITVVAPQIDPQILQLTGNVCVKERTFEPEDLKECVLVVAATDDVTENHRIARMAQKKHIPVNAVDQQEDCSFIFPSYLKHRDLVGAFSSAGNSPVLTQYLKESLKEILTEELGQINDYMGSIRPVVKTRIETEKLRRQVYQTILARLLAEKKTSLLPEELEQILENNRLDEIAITLALREYYKLKRIVAICEKSGVHTKFVPDYNDIIPTRPYTEDLLGLPVVNIRHVPLTNSFNMICKRAMDIVGAIVAIIIFSPVMLVTAVLVKTTSKGPLIYKQERVGLHNQTFQMYKFRSMEVQSAKSEKRAWTVRDDPRVTKVGRVIRKTSIDELPQLFNILKGDMSLVGPRPERPFFVEKFREEIPRYMVKHQVRPGLTGWAQVNGYRGDTSIKKRIEYDLYYIENWTMGLDIKILFLTFFKGFVNKNAY